MPQAVPCSSQSFFTDKDISHKLKQQLPWQLFTLTSNKWLDAYDAIRAQAKKAFIAEINAIAKQNKTMPILESMGRVMTEPEYQLPLDAQGDTAIYVLARNSGEGNDRKPEAQMINKY